VETEHPGVNWAGNISYSARELCRPDTVPELQELVASASRVRALGSRHSFSSVADSTGVLVDLARLGRSVDIDTETATARISAGIRYGELTPILQRTGFALPNLGSLPHISVAGACATGTHGSGTANRTLGGAVRAVEFVDGTGAQIRLARDPNGQDTEFNGSVVAVGALGIVTELTLDLVPSYDVRQDIYLGLALDRLEDHFAEVMASAYSVSLFLDFKAEVIDKVWQKRLVPAGDTWQPEAEWLGAQLATVPQHPVPGQPADSATPQLGSVGPWNERLPHFRLDFTPSSGRELQSEYLLPASGAVNALSGLRRIGNRLAPLLQVAEIRSVAADDLWLSPAYGTDVIAFHFTWIDDWPAVRAVLPVLEAAFDGLSARPHWGKLFTMPASEVRGRYERLGDFQRLAEHYDPSRKFANDYLDEYVYLQPTGRTAG
jgi:alditol oxidase